MKIFPKYLVLLTLVLTVPVIMAARHAEFRAPGQPKAALPVVTKLLTNAVTASSLLFFNTGLAEKGLPFDAFMSAMKGFSKLRERNMIGDDSILTIVDFTKSSKEKRLYVVDLKNQDILFQTLVAHGKNSGQEYARSFSNKPKSNKSSLGFYITQGTYRGSNGYSLKLQGTETGINDLAFARAIVMHGADYASENMVDSKGFIGRSYGCPALPEKESKAVIDRIKNGNVIFVYYPDPIYMKKSKMLNG